METSQHKALKWGVLSTAAIGTRKVIPAIQQSQRCHVAAIASRDGARAERVATELGIERAHPSYEALLADPDIDVVYNPLPNHLHVPWTVRAAEAGKHVLCEKPIAITADEAQTLLAVRDATGARIQEAFMVRTHPQWVAVRDMVAAGDLGELRAIQGFFSYFNDDPADIRNQADIGGGGMLDIGCYPVTTSRFVTGAEPTRVVAVVDRDPRTGIDRLGTALLDFPGVQASFTYSTQLLAYQRMAFVGSEGRVEVEIPFNAPPDRPTRLLRWSDGAPGAEPEVIQIATCDQYTVAADAFAASIADGSPQPVPLEDSIQNMRVLDALLLSAEQGTWQHP
ncbi:MAG TPA: Gfo/Idh/MocA family oxidoreductase [Egibacteraceae bacterium]|nr:Gfo/Idh/MocA family oxidoreductase [Egibacteraceae bacterium]